MCREFMRRELGGGFWKCCSPMRRFLTVDEEIERLKEYEEELKKEIEGIRRRVQELKKEKTKG